MPDLVHQILVRDPVDGVVKGFGPQDNPVPDWVRDVAPGEHLWVEPAKKPRRKAD